LKNGIPVWCFKKNGMPTLMEVLFFEMPCIYVLLVPRMMDLTTPLKSEKDLMPLRAKASPPIPHDLHMFKFIIMFILHFTICKAHIGG
jgi:hypothetical protein